MRATNRTLAFFWPFVSVTLSYAATSTSQDTAREIEAALRAETPASCPVTQVNGGEGGIYGNESVDVSLPAKSRFIFAPGQPGFAAVSDGALGMKVGWERHQKGQLRISGRRLDGSAKALRARIPDGYGESGFQSTYLIFPTPGCWEVTGTVAQDSLVFVVWVVKVAEGPTWRQDY
jgi:hypothetical protein